MLKKEIHRMNKIKRKYSSNDSSESNRRKTVGVTIRPKLLAQARERKINLSNLLENALKQKLTPNNTFLGEASFQKKVLWCSGRDSNPGLRLERPKYLTGLYYRSLNRSFNPHKTYTRFNFSALRRKSSLRRGFHL